MLAPLFLNLDPCHKVPKLLHFETHSCVLLLEL
ncbi:Uncharacterised protein [Hafnia alvei]|nr:Uncharacterised protein [Hafnia alvei]